MTTYLLGLVALSIAVAVQGLWARGIREGNGARTASRRAPSRVALVRAAGKVEGRDVERLAPLLQWSHMHHAIVAILFVVASASVEPGTMPATISIVLPICFAGAAITMMLGRAGSLSTHSASS